MRRDTRKLSLTNEQLKQKFVDFTIADLYRIKEESLESFKYYCTMASLYMTPEQLWDLVLHIIKQSKQERSKEEIEIVVQQTSTLKFFQQLNSKQRNIANRLHEKIAAALEHESYPQGSIIFRQDDPPKKFYIILKGSVNIYLLKEQQQILTQVNALNAQQAQNPKQRSVMQIFDMIKTMTTVESVRELAERFKKKRAPLARHSVSRVPLPDISNDEAYKQIQQQIGNIPPEALQDIDFYYFKGVFRHRFITTLQAGSMFGELGILMNKGRTASTVAQEDTELAVLSADFYKHLLRDVDLRKMQERIDFFTTYFFQSMPLNIVMKYCYNFETRRLVRGDYVYKQDEEARAVFIIVKGEIKLVKQLKSVHVEQLLVTSQRVSTQELYEIGVGQIFGEVEIIRECPRTSSAMCQSEKGKVYYLDVEIFRRLLKDNANMRQSFEGASRIKSQFESKRTDFLDAGVINEYRSASSNHSQHHQPDQEQETIIKQSNQSLLNKIKLSVSKKRSILESKGGYFPSGQNQSTIPKELMDMRRSLVQISGKNRFEHLGNTSFYRVPPQVKKTLRESQALMSMIRDIYNKDRDLPDTVTKNFDDFKQKFKLRLPSEPKNNTFETLVYAKNSFRAKRTNHSRQQSRPSQTSRDSMRKVSQQLIEFNFETNQSSRQLIISKRESPVREPSKLLQLVREVKRSGSAQSLRAGSASTSATLIASKHNMFRLKPSRQYLIDSAYRN